ncbi:Butirosin biosynthesis, BtrG-like protein [Gloeopeniophorella convolvens]|nr:Butirosin biosynthesis, BtrG-like protein [Gloeopeniophorella convolvens]
MIEDFYTSRTTPVLYFGYGSNLWIDQMNRRCPENKYIGVGILQDWCWIINQRGYANVVPSPGDRVYGLVYELGARDEDALDMYEGVPTSYEKRTIPIEVIKRSDDGETATETLDALVYIDFLRTSHDVPKTEYIHRINMGVADALKEGVPQSYVDRYIRPFIPEE